MQGHTGADSSSIDYLLLTHTLSPSFVAVLKLQHGITSNFAMSFAIKIAAHVLGGVGEET